MKNQNILKSDNTTSKDLFIEGVERANIFGMQNANLWGDGFMVGAMAMWEALHKDEDKRSRSEKLLSNYKGSSEE